MTSKIQEAAARYSAKTIPSSNNPDIVQVEAFIEGAKWMSGELRSVLDQALNESSWPLVKKILRGALDEMG